MRSKINEVQCKGYAGAEALPFDPLFAYLPAQVKPEAQSYYQLGAATLKFTFPEPAPLDGVTSKQKSILSMKKVGCQYG